MKIRVQDGKITIQAAQKVVVEAPQIELVENATHPLVFGDNLLTYLNQLVQMFNSRHASRTTRGRCDSCNSGTAGTFLSARSTVIAVDSSEDW